MWPSILDVAKTNPFGTPFVTAKCQGQNELAQTLVRNRHIAAASVEGAKLWHSWDSRMPKFCCYLIQDIDVKNSCEFGSNKYFMLCGLGGILSCGITHTMVTPLDLVTLAEDGTRGLVKGWAPTFFGYSIQGMFKFGLYEVFKVYYSAFVGEEVSYEYRTTLYLVSSASAEFFADIGLAPLEASKVKIQTTPGFANTLREAMPKIYGEEGLGGFYKGLVPLWLRQIPYTMMKFACFERTVELLYKYVVPKPRQECTKGEQLVVTFAAGYIAGVFCAIVSHPADSVVSKLNQEKGASAVDVLKKMGFVGVWKGLGPRIIMIGTLTAAQWFIYDAVKVWLRMPRPPPPEMPESLKKKYGLA
ncbi:Phosphate carrier protein, mitochondrial [Melipona quadrifasciata]|uniref:Phosphate carrier protein, mitochondrial n=1 Tax=Melipona quadrifasciata TaxID=166423 RepID=A0A0N0BK10_9HYME|nr:Phosphate carrier protein, mitochondrial [Melipona quadrifasciata]